MRLFAFRSAVTSALVSVSLAALAAPASAQAGVVSAALEQTLLPRDGAGNERFGSDVALSGDELAVGAAYQQQVTLFTRNGDDWTSSAELFPPENETVVAWRFGERLELQGDTLVVAAPLTEFASQVVPGFSIEDAGAVYVYTRDAGGWQFTQLIAQPGGPRAEHEYGTDVALDGDTLMVSALGKTDAGNQNGAVFVYTRVNGVWIHADTLEASVPHSLNSYGKRVLLEGDRAVVSAANANVGPEFRAGQVYVYARENGAWSELVKLSSPAPVALAAFGFAVALHEGRLVAVDAPNTGARVTEIDISGEQVALAGFTELAALLPGTVTASVALHDDSLLLTSGAFPFETGYGVYHLERDGFSFADPTLLHDGLDFAVLDTDGERLAIGDAYDDTLGTNAGAVTLLRLDLPPWAWVESGTPGGNALIPELLADGTLQPGSSNSLELRKGAPGGSAALVLGLSLLEAPFKGGVLVPAPDLVRPGFTLGPDGALLLPFTWPAGVPSGTQLHLQAWFVDGDAASGFASSNAVTGETP